MEKYIMFDTQVGLVVAVRGVACFLKTCKQKNTKWFFLGSLLLLIGVVCFEKKVRKKIGVRLCWLVWFGLAWFGLVWLLWVVGWLKNVEENGKMVVPRLFVAVDCCCLF
jgi:hypothetical protein